MEKDAKIKAKNKKEIKKTNSEEKISKSNQKRHESFKSHKQSPIRQKHLQEHQLREFLKNQGISVEEEIFSSQFLINNVCLIYSTISKIINRQATGYALLLTTAARDGGLREDSIKILAPLLHPRQGLSQDFGFLIFGALKI